jgi:hypothetical protein
MVTTVPLLRVSFATAGGLGRFDLSCCPQESNTKEAVMDKRNNALIKKF